MLGTYIHWGSLPPPTEVRGTSHKGYEVNEEATVFRKWENVQGNTRDAGGGEFNSVLKFCLKTDAFDLVSYVVL